jgi:hypothetical protein
VLGARALHPTCGALDKEKTMRADGSSPSRAGSWRLALAAVPAILLLLAGCTVASAQCAPDPAGKTAVALRNTSSHYVIFFIDGVEKAGVLAGAKSEDFVVTAAEHVLRGDAMLEGKITSAHKTGKIPQGHVCTWNITDPKPPH